MNTNPSPDPKNNMDEETLSYHTSLITYRSDKRWKIFDWASKLLLATIAGGIATNLVPNLQPAERALLVLAVLFLGGYAIGWLRRNDFYLRNSLRAIGRPEPEIPLPLQIFSYEVTIGVLTVVSILIIWLAGL